MYHLKTCAGQDTAGNSPFSITFKGLSERNGQGGSLKEKLRILVPICSNEGTIDEKHLIWIDLVQINHGLKNESDACQELGIMVTQEHRCLVFRVQTSRGLFK